MDELEAIQLVSFSLVAKTRREESTGDSDYIIRYVHRWYSKKFNTPLHVVYELPTYDVLRAFYEEKYEGMSDDDLENERLELVKTDKQREDEARKKALEEVDGFEMAKEEEEDFDSPVAKLEKAAGQFKNALGRIKGGIARETEIEMGGIKTTLLPDIKMTFVTEEELDLDSDSLGMLDPPKSK